MCFQWAVTPLGVRENQINVVNVLSLIHQTDWIHERD